MTGSTCGCTLGVMNTAHGISVFSDPRTLVPGTLMPMNLELDGGSRRASLMVKRAGFRGYSAKTRKNGWEVIWAGRTEKGWTRNYTHKCRTEAEAFAFAEKKFGDLVTWINRQAEKEAA